MAHLHLSTLAVRVRGSRSCVIALGRGMAGAGGGSAYHRVLAGMRMRYTVLTKSAPRKGSGWRRMTMRIPFFWRHTTSAPSGTVSPLKSASWKASDEIKSLCMRL
jgi:hypothetical protein